MTTTALPRGAGLALLLLCVANFLDAMDISTIGMAVPLIEHDLGMTPVSVQWAVSAYVLGYGGFLLLGGRVADIFGHRRVFLWSLAIFAVASIAGAFVDSAPELIAARLVKGIAAAFTAPAALSLLLGIFSDGEARGRALGRFASTGATGFVLGLVIGGALTVFNWRATVVLPAPIALIVLVLSLSVLPPDRRSGKARPRFDVAGAITATPALLLLVFGITNAAVAGWTAPLTWGSLALAIVLGVLFLIIESRHSDPMVPLEMFRRRKLNHANIVALLFQGTYIGFQFVATFYYQSVFGWSAFATGACFALGGMCVMFLAPRFARMAERRGATGLLTAGMALQAAGYLVWVLGFERIGPLLVVVLSQLCLGMGYAMTYPSVQVAALADIEEDKSGLASGMLFAALQIGGGLVLAVTSAVFSAAPGWGWNPYLAGAIFSMLLALGTVLVAALGPRARRLGAPAGAPAE